MPAAAVTGQSTDSHPSGSGAALGAAVLGFLVITLDAQVVNVALPQIGQDLGGGMIAAVALLATAAATFLAPKRTSA